MNRASWVHAVAFLAHYLSNSGDDLVFSSVDAYGEDSNFKAAVDRVAGNWIRQQRSQDVTFDTGYVGLDISEWQNDFSWRFAIGGCYYRLVGVRIAGGSWTVSLQLTSYYQHKIGEVLLDVLPTGAVFRYLEQLGWAKNFREIGTGALTYSATGNPL
jgi:hypothetical protein